MTLRYAACALALEFGCFDVDAMLERMDTKQLFEWLAFFKVRDEERKREPGTRPPAQQSKQALQMGLIAAFRGMKERREGKSARPD